MTLLDEVDMELQRILLIEDEADIRHIARLALERLGNFTVEECCAGNEATAKAKQINPDLILLDVMMPGMDGPTTLQELRSIPELAQIPVVFMTAKVQPQEQKQYTDLGAIGVIAKPFDPAALPDTLRRLWNERRQPA